MLISYVIKVWYFGLFLWYNCSREFGLYGILRKKIQINENRILIFSITEGYAKPTFTIMEGFLENGNVIKTYSLSQWDDYGLNGWSNNNEDLDRISFEFDMNHPLKRVFKKI